jgi:hypothetical protein
MTSLDAFNNTAANNNAGLDAAADPLAAFDALFDRDLAELAELSAWEIPPTGVYAMECTIKFKPTAAKKPAVEAAFKVLHCVQQADPNEKPAKEGQEFSTSFVLLTKDNQRNEMGEGAMRALLEPFGTHLGTSNIKQLVDGRIDKMQVIATVVRRPQKDDPDRFNVRIKDLTIAA